MHRFANTAFVQPLAYQKIVRTKPIVLMDHKAYALADIGDESFSFAHGAGQRFLHFDMDAMVGGEACYRSVGINR